jgi:hypothetical protein
VPVVNPAVAQPPERRQPAQSLRLFEGSFVPRHGNQLPVPKLLNHDRPSGCNVATKSYSSIFLAALEPAACNVTATPAAMPISA